MGKAPNSIAALPNCGEKLDPPQPVAQVPVQEEQSIKPLAMRSNTPGDLDKGLNIPFALAETPSRHHNPSLTDAAQSK